MTKPDEPPQTETLRDRNRARTRQAILDACVEIELFHGGAVRPEMSTFARIAEVAGVSERTVYRMFPSRAELDRALQEQGTLTRGIAFGDVLTDRPRVVREITRRWNERHPARLSDARLEDWDGDFPASIAARGQRDEELLTRVRKLLGRKVPDRQARAVTAALHSTVSIATIVASAMRWNLTLAEAGEAHTWMLETLIDAIEREPLPPWEIPDEPDH
jgi:AcrR family transcriptional regulator